jgi:hypothetical protein
MSDWSSFEKDKDFADQWRQYLAEGKEQQVDELSLKGLKKGMSKAGSYLQRKGSKFAQGFTGKDKDYSWLPGAEKVPSQAKPAAQGATPVDVEEVPDEQPQAAAPAAAQAAAPAAANSKRSQIYKQNTAAFIDTVKKAALDIAKNLPAVATGADLDAQRAMRRGKADPRTAQSAGADRSNRNTRGKFRSTTAGVKGLEEAGPTAATHQLIGTELQTMEFIAKQKGTSIVKIISDTLQKIMNDLKCKSRENPESPNADEMCASIGRFRGEIIKSVNNIMKNPDIDIAESMNDSQHAQLLEELMAEQYDTSKHLSHVKRAGLKALPAIISIALRDTLMTGLTDDMLKGALGAVGSKIPDAKERKRYMKQYSKLFPATAAAPAAQGAGAKVDTAPLAAATSLEQYGQIYKQLAKQSGKQDQWDAIMAELSAGKNPTEVATAVSRFGAQSDAHRLKFVELAKAQAAQRPSAAGQQARQNVRRGGAGSPSLGGMRFEESKDNSTDELITESTIKRWKKLSNIKEKRENNEKK